MINKHAPNDAKMQFKHHPRHLITAKIPSVNTKAQLWAQLQLTTELEEDARDADVLNHGQPNLPQCTHLHNIE